MFRIARMFLSLGTSRLADTRDQIGRKAAFIALLVLFGLMFLIFGLAAITAAFAHQVGLISALAIMAVVALFCVVITLILMKSAEKRYRVRALERAELNSRLRQLAMLSAMSAARPKAGQLIGLGILAAGAMLIFNRLGGRAEEDEL